MSACASATTCTWREDIDSLAFQPEGHTGQCVIHRRAFRALVAVDITPENCRDYFERNRALFQTAAAAKIGRRKIHVAENFHLNSRDIRRTSIAT